MPKKAGIPYSVGEARAYLRAVKPISRPKCIDLYPAELLRYLCDEVEILRAALRKIAIFDFDAGCDVDDIMSFAKRAYRGELDADDFAELLLKDDQEP